MKKKIFSLAVIAIIIVAAAIGVSRNANKEKLLNLTLANVEALAEYESGDVIVECGRYSGRCWTVDWVSPIINIYCHFTGLQIDFCAQ